MTQSTRRSRSRSTSRSGVVAVAALLLVAGGPGCGTSGQVADEGGRGTSDATAAPAESGAFDPVVHLGEVEAWRARRHEALTSPDGWLSLVGLYWLAEGANTFGREPSNDLVYEGSPYDEEPVPERIGTFLVDGGSVRFRAAPRVEVRAVSGDGAGERVSSALIHVAEGVGGGGEARPGDRRAAAAGDAAAGERGAAEDGEPAEKGGPVRREADAQPVIEELGWGPLTWYVIERQGELGVRLESVNSPVLEEFRGIDYFPVDDDWRIEGRFERHDPPKTIRVPNVLGGVYEHESPGAAVFEIDGRTRRLDFWYDAPDDVELFTVFGDETNGDETYGGGRFLRIDPPDEEGRVVLDFNRAYNPPCVFTDFSTCPLPPPQNRLAVPVPAGEKDYGARD